LLKNVKIGITYYNNEKTFNFRFALLEHFFVFAKLKKSGLRLSKKTNGLV